MVSSNSIIVTREEAPAKKQAIVREVLADLPEWFGLPASTQEYIEAAATLPLWVAKQNDQVIGFIDFDKTTQATGEINCMGVKKAYHHKGVGRQLFQALAAFARQHAHYLQVKTVDEGHYPEYDRTIRFYEAMGFERLEVFPQLWDAWNPCLVLVKKL